MEPQLQTISDELESARGRLRALAARLTADGWIARPSSTQWSPSECVAHLNLTAEAYIPVLRDALERARSLPRASGRYRRDVAGWILWKMMGPPIRFKVKTAAAFVPTASEPPDRLIEAFEALQDVQLRCVREADGLPLNDVRVVSPFDARVRYNLYSCLSILPRHQHRHLWQAEQAERAR